METVQQTSVTHCSLDLVLYRTMASRLYAHAQHSVLAFCMFSELVTIVRLNRSWKHAVASCPSKRVDLWLPDLVLPASTSDLFKHVASFADINSKGCLGVQAEQLCVTSERMTSLRDASFLLLAPLPTQGLLLPSSLTRLHLSFSGEFTAGTHNLAIEALGQLVHLVDLTLTACLTPELTFAPLVQLKAMRILTLLNPLPPRFSYRLHDAHVAEIRRLEWLETLVISQLPLSLDRLLALPHSLRWSCVDEPTHLHIDSNQGIVHPQLQSLTSLNLYHYGDSVSWLRSLPAIRCLRMKFRDLPPPHASLIEALMTCSQLEELTLQRFKICAAEFEKVVSCLRRLRLLDLQDGASLESLSFMAHPNLAKSLESLRLGPRIRVFPAELEHVYGLKRLRRLNLHGWSIQCKIEPHMRALLTPPSVVLPELQVFLCFE